MTDNGLAALAAALHAIHPGPRPWVGGLTDEEFAAAILGERGVFLPDGLPHDCETSMTINEDLAQRLAEIARLRTLNLDLIDAGITLRAALDGLGEAAYMDRPPTGSRPVPWTPVKKREWEAWARRIRAALAAAKETP